MDYQLELSPCSRYVYFRPIVVATTPEEIAARRVAMRELALQEGLTRIMLDYRNLTFPKDLRHYDAVLEGRNFLIQGEWRVVFLISFALPSNSAKLIMGMARLLTGMTVSAACFAEREEGEAWLLSSAPPPPDQLPAPPQLDA